MRSRLLKLCSRCKQEKPFDQFNHYRRAKDGYHAWCRHCNHVYQKEWAIRTGKSAKDKARYRKYKESGQFRKDTLQQYGLTTDSFNKLFEKQDRLCAICYSPTTSKGKEWAVDHNHITNEVRGILCSNCNSALGLMKDDIIRLARAIEYLKESNV